MLTNDQIEINKSRFLGTLKNALEKRPGADIDGLINKLENSDFFMAPASTKYHASYKGGLVQHSLNVYDNMVELAKMKHLLAVHVNKPVFAEPLPDADSDAPTEIIDYKDEVIEGCIEESSIAIVALLHDFSKMNYYKQDYRNKKVYCESGSKHDNLGRFDWVSEISYTTIPSEERFIYGSHEETSDFMVRCYIPLTYEESTAILHHHYGMGFDSIKDSGVVSRIYERYPIAALLHAADLIAASIDER